jgi:hypothetical protein
VKQAMANAWGAVRDKVRDAWNNIVDSLRSKFDDIRKSITNLKGDVVQAFQNMWSAVRDGVGKAWSRIVDTVHSWVGKVIGPINKILGFLHAPQIPGFSGGGVAHSTRGVNASGGAAQFATGGITAPHSRNDQGIYKAVPGGVYKLAEAGHDEAVISLDPSKKNRSIEIMAETMRRLGVVPQFGIGGIIKKHVGNAARGVGSALGGVASTIGDIAGGFKDFFTDPKKWLLSHLPKPPDLAGQLGHMATLLMQKVFDAAVKYIMGKSGGASVQRAAAEAERIARLHLPYVWGGGHVSNPLAYPEGTGGGFDCSGYVSRVLEVAGVMRGPALVSGMFGSRGQPGLGSLSTLSNSEHVYMMIGGRAFGTSSYNPGGGAGGPLPYGVRSGFTVRHYDRGGVVPGQGAQLAMVHGGETILPTHKRRGVVHFAPTINVYPQPGQDERTIAALIDRRLRRFNAVFS